MSDRSKIEWTDATWNPITGCTPVSEGCTNCYAKRMEGRNLPGHHVGPFDKIQFHPDRLGQPFCWYKPRRIFVCSLGDLFHKQVSKFMLKEIFGVMMMASGHTFMVLTKRPDRMKAFMDAITEPDGKITSWGEPGIWTPDIKEYAHIWLGVTAENQEQADERIPILLQTPAAKRFVSIEPCIGPVDLTGEYLTQKLGRYPFPGLPDKHRTKMIDLLDWVILGGETGPGARYMPGPAPQSIRDQCVSAGVPFFFKGWGTYGMKKSDPLYMRIDGREWKQFPEGKEGERG
ncbi:MAG: phage Gp37/Gp68 family protein [Deltaproteobacteria bacterium]|nr:phage Gp37/Gp68 family protein [Deltaproteobacteria bacterium]